MISELPDTVWGPEAKRPLQNACAETAFSTQKRFFCTGILPGSKEWFAVPGSLGKPHKSKEREILHRYRYSKNSRIFFNHEKF